MLSFFGMVIAIAIAAIIQEPEVIVVAFLKVVPAA